MIHFALPKSAFVVRVSGVDKKIRRKCKFSPYSMV